MCQEWLLEIHLFDNCTTKRMSGFANIEGYFQVFKSVFKIFQETFQGSRVFIENTFVWQLYNCFACKCASNIDTGFKYTIVLIF